jgi:uncharacterized protein with HEPN domain
VKDDRVYLEHIRDALRDITTYTSAGRDAFFDDPDNFKVDAEIVVNDFVTQACDLLPGDFRLT